MEIITILGDSLSMARAEDGLLYQNLYAYKLASLLGEDFHVLNKSKRANTIVNQCRKQHIYDDVETTCSSYFIIQLGIVDCAPRVFSLRDRQILKILKPVSLRNLIINMGSKYRKSLTRYFPKVYVNQTEFETKYKYLLDKILSQKETKKIFVINIADTNTENKEKSFGFEKNLMEYNQIIKKICDLLPDRIQLIDLYGITKSNPDLVLSDGIHISQRAHDIIVENILFYFQAEHSNDHAHVQNSR